jgi:hypothetical protein
MSRITLYCHYVKNRVLPLAASLLLAACGGGDSGGGGGGLGGISLNASVRSASSIYLSWSKPTNGLTVSPYLVARDDDLLRRTIGSTTERNYLVGGLAPNTRYCFIIKDPLTANRLSNRACATTEPDTTAPSVPTALIATAASPSSIDISWVAASDAGGVGGYYLYRDTVRIATITGVRYTDDTASPGVEYCYRVSAFDHSGNESEQSNESCSRPELDVEAPSTPQDVTASYQDDNGSPTITVNWTPASDNSRISHYVVTRDGVEVSEIPAPPYTDTDVQESTTYCYSVTAFDIAGNPSAASETVCTRTSWTKQGLGIANAGAATIALDSAGVPWVAYKDRYFENSQSVYRSRLQIGAIGDTFVPELLNDSIADVFIAGEYAMDMVLDSDDVANILHQSTPGPGSEQLDYVTRSDTMAASIAVQTSIVYLQDVKIAIDQAGVLHACVRYDNASYYAENSSGTWLLTELDSLGGDTRGNNCSIATAGDGSVHLVYLGFLREDLWHLSNQSGSWVATMIDQQSGTSTDTAYHTAISVDTSGFAHIVYAHDYADNHLEYASNRSGNWVVEKVDESGKVGYRSDIVTNSLDRVSIIYQEIDSGASNLRFASREAGSWESYQLSSSSTGPVSVAVDSNDRLHIVFSDLGGELTYMTGQ